MASYKVLQDIEAEDKLVGPLTLRQFIYAGVFALCLYFGFIAITKHLTFFLIILVPVALVAAFFAFPWKLNQPTETWALAMVKFFLKPRKRIWDQSGVKEIVTITAPKVESLNYTNNLSETEVESRLKNLANILDSRGWAIKNSADSFNYRSVDNDNSDRLVDITVVRPTTMEPLDTHSSDDILDDTNNPTAQRFSQMINNSSQARFSGIKDKIRLGQEKELPTNSQKNQPLSTSPNAASGGNWFIQNKRTSQDSLSTPKIQLHSFGLDATAGRTNKPSSIGTRNSGQASNSPAVTQPSNPVILNLAGNNDLDVATIARQINKQQVNGLQNEVIVQLH